MVMVFLWYLSCYGNGISLVSQVKDKVSLGRTALLVMGVTDVCLEHITETENDLRKLMTFLLDLCWEFLAQSLDVSMVTRYLTRAAEVAPNVCNKIQIISCNYFI